MRIRALAALLALSPLLGAASVWAGEDGWVRTTQAVPARDGARLAAEVWLPEGPGPWPALLVQTPYGRTRTRPEHLVDGRDFAVVVLDWRGFHGSRDAGAPARGRQRGTDGYDAVEWVAAQPWCTGKVGTWGPSALGGVQYATAQERPPHLACAVPIVTGLTWEYRTFHPGGVLREEYVDVLGKIGFPTAPPMIRAHPLEDAVWRLAPQAVDPTRIDVPMLLVGGWFDLHPDQMVDDFRTLAAQGGEPARSEHRLLMGPWTHHFIGSYAADARDLPYRETLAVAREEVRRWFDRWLRGVVAGPSPRVRYYVPGEEAWRSADAWPPPGARSVTYRLSRTEAGGVLVPDGAPVAEGRDEFRHDPRDPVPTVGGGNLDPRLPSGPRDQRLDVLVRPEVRSYLTPPLEAPLALAGRVRAHMRVVVEGPDADLHVRLCDVHPDGRAVLMADGVRRLSLRNSFERAEPVPNGEPVDVTVDVPDLAWSLPAGHRLLVALAGSNAPRYEVAGAPVTVRVLRGGDGGSAIVLPVAAEGPAGR